MCPLFCQTGKPNNKIIEKLSLMLDKHAKLKQGLSKEAPTIF